MHLSMFLTTAPVLSYPDFSKEIVLETDPSLKGLGAVLSQVGNDGKSHVITYASRFLCPSERSKQNYSSDKLELLALKWAIMEKSQDYLLDLNSWCTPTRILWPMCRKVKWEHARSVGSVN